MHSEPEIYINGVPLTMAQAMAVRVAISAFRMELGEPEFKKELGIIGRHYNERLAEVEEVIYSDVI